MKKTHSQDTARDQSIPITILGGSVISHYGIDSSERTFSQNLIENNPRFSAEKVISIGTLRFAKAVSLIAEIEPVKVLVLYFGTSVGWPQISYRLENFLRPSLTSPTGMHLSFRRSQSRKRGIYAKIRHLLRFLLKIILYPVGLYRPRQAIEELPDLIDAIVKLALQRADLVIWVQHQSLGYKRLWFERRTYSDFYKLIFKNICLHESPNFRVLTTPTTFLVQENYLLDGVHLSSMGHAKMAKLVCEAIETYL